MIHRSLLFGFILFALTVRAQTFKAAEHPSTVFTTDILSIITSEKGELWTVSGSTILKYRGDSIDYQTSVPDFQFRDPRLIREDATGNIWISSPVDGLARYSDSTWTHFTMNHGLISNQINYMVIDKSNHVWVATMMGVSWFDGHGWSSFKYEDPEGAWQNFLNSGMLYTDPSGTVCIYYRGDIYRFSNNEWTCIYKTDLPSYAAQYPVIPDNYGVLWRLSKTSVSRFDGTRWHLLTTSPDVQDDLITAVVRDKNNILYVGTYSNGIAAFDGTKWRRYTAVNSDICSDYIRCLHAAPDGKIWIGTNSGLCSMNP